MGKVPSIFNDVMGPIMSGPSSSHTAASWRIARVCLDILNEPLKYALIEFDKNSAWAKNFREQGTAMGINGGLLGLDIVDERMKDTECLVEEKNISIKYKINSFATNHVNTVRLTLKGMNNKNVQVLGASLGGGAFEIQKINGIDISITGDNYDLLVINRDKINIPKNIKDSINANEGCSNNVNWDSELINIKSSKMFNNEIIVQLNESGLFKDVILINPILPIVIREEIQLPFTDINDMIIYAENKNLDLGEIGLLYERSLSNLSGKVISDRMNNIVSISLGSIETGMKGTEYDDRILQQQSNLIGIAEKKGNIFNSKIINNTIANITAIMESKSAMEVIVANPTAGSCGTVAGVLKAAADELNKSKDDLIKAFFAGGMVGVYFANGPGFSAEEHGCQVECGAASGMAAAGIMQLFGGNARQSVDAASLAIQNMIGLVCDPVGDRVEVPCLGKNISAAMNAISSATMVSSGYDAVIPLEEVIETVSIVSKQMPACVKCTGTGGLALTPSSINIKERLNSQ